MYHCIVNTRAGRGSGKEWISPIDAFMREQGKEIVFEEPKTEQEASIFAHNVCLSGSEGIIGIGGDGTVQKIVTGMLQNTKKCEIPLGIISCGSGNDLVRTFSSSAPIAKQSDKDYLSQFLMGIIHNEHQTIDAIRINDKACLNVANIGLDARIVKNAKRLKKTLGGKAYLISAFISIVQHENLDLHIRIQNSEKEYDINGRYTLVAICNGQYYGGGMKIAPPARINDGRITLCLISELSRLKAFRLFPTVLTEQHVHLKEVKYVECERCIITPTNHQVDLCTDGNLSKSTGSIEFEILPNAMRVIF